MEDNTLTIEKVIEAVTPLERKYDWNVVHASDDEFTLTITDGSHEASADLTSLEGIEELVKGLETELDEQDYPVIG